ncbi:MAG: hypothetical protein NTW29_11535 [Bacteroidetes bacterium]|nr:hypothetical protein [Bacteroidota bacterium]
MHLKQPKSIYQIGLALVFAAFSFTACTNSGEKKEDANKTDTTKTTPAPAPTPAQGPDSTGGGGDTLKQKPTAPGD